MGKFKRKQVNCTIHEVDVYNPSPKQSKKTREFLSKLNSDMIVRIGEEAKKCMDDGVELTDEMLNYAKTDALSHQIIELENKKKEWILEYTSLDEIDDEDVADPGVELKDIIRKINEVCIKPEVEMLQPMFENIYAQAIKQINSKYELGE